MLSTSRLAKSGKYQVAETVRPRVAHVTTVHPADDIRIFRKQCRSLSAAGYDVIQIASGGTRSPMTVGVKCVHIDVPHRRLGRATLGQFRAFIAALRVRADLYHFHDPELLPLIMTLRILGKVCVYDAHEHLSTDVLDKPWISRRWKPLFVRLSRVMERALALSSSALIAATPGIAEHFPSAKTVLVQNFPLREELEFFTGARPRLDAAGKRRFVFLGLLNKIRGGFQLVEALRRVERKDIVVTIVGQIAEPDLLHDLQELEATGKLELLGWQPREVALKLVAESAAGLLLYQPVKHHELSLPNKLFEYMALGLPVIASNFKLWSEIVGSADCGWIVDPVDPDEIARALAACAADPVAAAAKGRNGREAIRERYIWDTEAEKLISLYARLLGPRL